MAASVRASSASVTAVLNCASVQVIPTILVWSHVFVPEFVPVISVVNARVPLASFSVYVLSAVFVLVNRALNVFATLRSANIPARKVFTQVANVLVLVRVGIVTHSTAITQADTRVILVSEACQSSIDHTHSAVDVLAVIPATGNPVQFVSVPLVGVQRTGVVKFGDVIV